MLTSDRRDDTLLMEIWRAKKQEFSPVPTYILYSFVQGKGADINQFLNA
jgi:hypothetical protein